MFARIARVVGNLFTVVDDTKPSNRVRLAVEGLEDRCTPATFTVDSVGDFADSNPGDEKAGAMVGPVRMQEFKTSLRSAIMEGNALAAAGKGNDHTIEFDTKAMGDNVISLTKALPVLAANFTITGSFGNVVTVERPAGLAQFRIFDVEAKRDVSLGYLGIRGGDTLDNGGGVRSSGHLLITECELYNNRSSGGGGVAAMAGSLSISYSILRNNTGTDGGGGVFTYNESKECVIQDCAIYDNKTTAVGGAIGGGAGLLVTGASTTILTSKITNNTATGYGGGFYSSSAITILGGEISNNTAGGDGGGGWISTGKDVESKWTQCKVTKNSAGGKGGGFYLKEGKLQFHDPVAFSDNKATGGLPGGAYLPPNASVDSKGLPAGSQSIDPDQ
jgi:predicted outer membrane repeat protein